MTNTYAKYCPNVFVAKCKEQHKKGDIIPVTTKRGKENDSIVHNFLFQGKDGYYYYSITRADGMNAQEYAKKRAEKLKGHQSNAEKKSDEYWQKSKEGADFLRLAEPIKIGHHSEKRHRALIERNANRMDNSVKWSNKAESYEDRIDYWESRKDIINLSMPESLEFYEIELEKVTAEHKDLKDNPEKRSHAFSLTYAKKAVNETAKNLERAKKLWGGNENE